VDHGPDDQTGLVLAGGADLVAERVAGPFDMPWSVALLADGSFLVTERPGHLQHVRPGADTQPRRNSRGTLRRHVGLLDIALDPEFADSRLVYISYLQGEETSSAIKVLRARYEESDEAMTDEEVIFEGSTGASLELLGGRLALTRDGYLFLSLGDRWERDKAQDLSGTAGTNHQNPHRRNHPRRQSLPLQGGRAARDLELWPPQPARPRLRPSYWRAMVR
jgi:glucose/arabinose dehydrogenase